MSLNKVKGNMYDWVNFTWNTIKGKCPHGCEYCYMKRWGEQPELHFDEKELKTDLGSNNFIFIGSSCDMFAKEIPKEWIFKTLNHCWLYRNRYLFQSKNPMRMWDLRNSIPWNSTVGTTIESNIEYSKMGKSPFLTARVNGMIMLKEFGFKTTVTIEPIMEFMVEELVDMIKCCNPEWVNIGSNTNSKCRLPEPKPGKVNDLIEALREFTKVKIKKNLKRLT